MSCKYCDEYSSRRRVFQEKSTGRWYIKPSCDDDNAEDELCVEYITNCPFCGRNLNDLSTASIASSDIDFISIGNTEALYHKTDEVDQADFTSNGNNSDESTYNEEDDEYADEQYDGEDERHNDGKKHYSLLQRFSSASTFTKAQICLLLVIIILIVAYFVKFFEYHNRSVQASIENSAVSENEDEDDETNEISDDGNTIDIKTVDAETVISDSNASNQCEVEGSHIYGSGVTATTATCSHGGTIVYTCVRCGKTKTETTQADTSKHTGGTVTVNATSATCTNDGYTGDVKCSECGSVISKGSVISAKGHAWDTGIVTKEATCTQTGTKTFTCSICGATKESTIDKDTTKHNGGTTVKDKRDATCSEDGYTGDTYCDSCNKKIQVGQLIPATGSHTFGAWSIIEEPTSTSDGVQRRTCTVCGYSEVASLARTS